MPTKLYTIPLSHPSFTARAALLHKGIDFETAELLGGAHPVLLKAMRFPTVTVPSVRWEDGTRTQGSVAICRAAEERFPDGPALYPADAAERARVEAAEQWGHDVLQPVPRRLIRWMLNHHLGHRVWFGRVATPLPAAPVVGVALTPVVPFFVLQAGARSDRVRQDLAELPGHLDHVDALIADGVIGGAEPNAADFQIGTSLAFLRSMSDIAPLIAGRPAEAVADRLALDYPTLPAGLRREWLPG